MALSFRCRLSNDNKGHSYSDSDKANQDSEMNMWRLQLLDQTAWALHLFNAITFFASIDFGLVTLPDSSPARFWFCPQGPLLSKLMEKLKETEC